MKRGSKVMLFLSLGCFLTGAGGIAAPNIRESFLNRIVPLNAKEESAPPITPVAPPEKSEFRYSVTDLAPLTGVDYFQALALNNRGDILGYAEVREPYTVLGRNGRPSQTRYRTTSTRYILYQNGHSRLIKEYKSLPTFRPIALNDRGQIVGFSFDPNEQPATENISNPFRNRPSARSLPNGFSPQMRSSRLMLWENGVFHDMKIPESLKQAGLPSRLLGLLETATLSFNNRGQLLIGFQNVYLWDNGSIKRISGSISNGERLYLNDNGMVVRRADQYRTSPDGANIYPLTAIYSENNKSRQIIDPGYYSSVFDLNNKNELLIGKMFISSGDTSRMRFSLSSGGTRRNLFTVNGRTPAHLNNQDFILAWRQQGTDGDWRHILSSGNGQNSSIPVLWDGKNLFDLETLIPTGWNLTGIVGMNDQNQILALARKDRKIHTLLLTPAIKNTQ